MEQLAIVFTGVITFWLSQNKCPKRRRYACLWYCRATILVLQRLVSRAMGHPVSVFILRLGLVQRRTSLLAQQAQNTIQNTTQNQS
ncbi:MAG: hypothetical protein V7707_10065 [Motiliproteus sp.]